MRIMTVRGGVDRAYMNAYAVHPSLEGVRIEFSIKNDGLRAAVFSEDIAALSHKSDTEIEQILVEACEIVVSGDADLYTSKELEAWII